MVFHFKCSLSISIFRLMGFPKFVLYYDIVSQTYAKFSNIMARVFLLGLHLLYSTPILGARIDRLGCSWNTYMVQDDDGANQCLPCTVCPPGYQVKQRCFSTSDTVCEPCPRRTYNPGSWDTCRKCTRCNPGDHVHERCTASMDTVCRRCPERTYSPRRNSHYCFSCKACRLNEDVVSSCTASRNTVCGNCSKEYFRDVSTGECLPCSRCPRKQPSLIVEECLRKLGHGRHICQPTAYLYQIEGIFDDTTVQFTMDEVVTKRQFITFEMADSFMISVYILGIVLLSTVIFVIVFAIVQDRHVQRCLRHCRDKTHCSCDDDSHSSPNVDVMTFRESETSGSQNHGSTIVRTTLITGENCSYEGEDSKENSSACLSTCEETSDCDASSGYETSSSCLRHLDVITSDDGCSFESDTIKLMATQNDAVRTAMITADSLSCHSDVVVVSKRGFCFYDVTCDSESKREHKLSSDAKSRRQKLRHSVCRLYAHPSKTLNEYFTI